MILTLNLTLTPRLILTGLGRRLCTHAPYPYPYPWPSPSPVSVSVSVPVSVYSCMSASVWVVCVSASAVCVVQYCSDCRCLHGGFYIVPVYKYCLNFNFWLECICSILIQQYPTPGQGSLYSTVLLRNTVRMNTYTVNIVWILQYSILYNSTAVGTVPYTLLYYRPVFNIIYSTVWIQVFEYFTYSTGAVLT